MHVWINFYSIQKQISSGEEPCVDKKGMSKQSSLLNSAQSQGLSLSLAEVCSLLLSRRQSPSAGCAQILEPNLPASAQLFIWGREI